MWPYAREHRRLLGAAVVLSVAAAGVSLAQPLVVGGIIAAVSDGRSWGGLGWALVGLLAVEVGVGTMQYYLLHRTAEGVVLGARTDLIRHVLRLPISEYRHRDIGDLVSRVGSDTTLLRGALTEGLVDALGGVFVLVGALAAMLLLDPVLAGVTVTVIAIVVAVSLLVGNRLRKLMFDTQSRLGDLTGDLTQTLSAVTVVRANGATERAQARLDERAAAAFAVGVRAARSSAAIQPLGRAAGQASLLIVLGIGGFRVAAGNMTVAELVTFVLFMFLFMGPVNVGFAAVQSVAGALGALQRITEIRRVPTEDAADTIRHRAVPHTAGPMLQFHDVHFAYTPGHAVLNGVSVSVERGSRTAVVGPSGAGKTTLLALIERFYDIDRGRIAIGGIDITELPRAVLREQIGYVEQNSPAVAGSIRDNLTFGAPHVSDERCRAALKAVDLLSRVDAEPRGLDAQIGENGVRLSGGERQRLALARVLLTEPPLLLLDEPTSSLDSRNEEIFQIALDATASDQTVLIVAHRLATVKNADQIVVLDSGRISAVGAHDELLTTSPLYRELARHQMIGAPNP